MKLCRRPSPRASRRQVLGLSSTGQPQHKVELRGLLPPWTTARLLHVLAETQPQRDVALQAVQSHAASASGSLNVKSAGGGPTQQQQQSVEQLGSGSLAGWMSCVGQRRDDAAGVDATEVARWSELFDGLSMRGVKRAVCSANGNVLVSCS